MSTYRLKEIVERTGTPEQIEAFKKKHPHLYEKHELTESQKEYWDRVRNPEPKRLVTADEALNEYIEHAREYAGRGFDGDVNHAHTELFMQYITKSDAFLSNTLVKNKPSFDKGMLLLGSVGSGKSCLMYAASRIRGAANPILGRFVNESQIVMEHDEISKYCKHNLIIDDLGKNNNGLEVRWVRQLLESRYILFKQRGHKTHVTTNLIMSGVDSFESVYGVHVFDRIKEMCNIVVLSRDKSLRE